MFNYQSTDRYLPSNTRCERTYPILDTIQAELVNEDLEYQNHRLQKNLLQYNGLKNQDKFSA